MTKRKRTRGNGEGSIITLGGKRKRPYAIRITVGFNEEGKQITKYLSYHSSKTEAKAALRKYMVNPYNLDNKDITINEILELWLEECTLTKETLINYLGAYNQAPQIHDRKIRDIKIAELKAAMVTLKPATQSAFKNILRHVYGFAIENEMIEKDLSMFLKPEQTPKTPRKPFTLDQIRKIKKFKHAQNDITLILLYTGFRITELLELKRENVNLEERYIYGGKKTATGKTRITPIHNDIYPIIKKHYDKGNKYLITKNNKPILYRTFMATYWTDLREYLGTDHTPHSTRHTFVTFSRKCGLDRTLVKKIVGHSSKDTTDRYDHADILELLNEINKLKYD